MLVIYVYEEVIESIFGRHYPILFCSYFTVMNLVSFLFSQSLKHDSEKFLG
jgi:hypothetical protein